MVNSIVTPHVTKKTYEAYGRDVSENSKAYKSTIKISILLKYVESFDSNEVVRNYGIILWTIK